MYPIARMILPAVSVVLLFAACGETPATEESDNTVAADTALVGDSIPQVTPEEPIEPVEEMAATDYLFDFYTIPADWPRSVPLMSDFRVTEYTRTETAMHAAGYGMTDISRANNYYTNARNEFVSTNIWAFDPANTSITEGETQAFYYTGEGHFLVIILDQTEPGRVNFTLDYTE